MLLCDYSGRYTEKVFLRKNIYNFQVCVVLSKKLQNIPFPSKIYLIGIQKGRFSTQFSQYILNFWLLLKRQFPANFHK